METTNGQQHDLEHLNFDNLTLRCVPIDPIPADDPRSKQSREVPGACYSRVHPTPLDNPKLVGISIPALELLDLDINQVGIKYKWYLLCPSYIHNHHPHRHSVQSLYSISAATNSCPAVTLLHTTTVAINLGTLPDNWGMVPPSPWARWSTHVVNAGRYNSRGLG